MYVPGNGRTTLSVAWYRPAGVENGLDTETTFPACDRKATSTCAASLTVPTTFNDPSLTRFQS